MGPQREFNLITAILLLDYELHNDLDYLAKAEDCDFEPNELHGLRMTFMMTHLPEYTWTEVLHARNKILLSNDASSLSKLHS